MTETGPPRATLTLSLDTLLDTVDSISRDLVHHAPSTGDLEGLARVYARAIMEIRPNMHLACGCAVAAVVTGGGGLAAHRGECELVERAARVRELRESVASVTEAAARLERLTSQARSTMGTDDEREAFDAAAAAGSRLGPPFEGLRRDQSEPDAITATPTDVYELVGRLGDFGGRLPIAIGIPMRERAVSLHTVELVEGRDTPGGVVVVLHAGDEIKP